MYINYDFHIHTGLSPCGNDDMSPNNIVNMALLCGLDVIAITDHNSCENAEVIMKIGKKKNLVVIPGMEVETREEVHVVCLFSDLDNVYNMQSEVYAHLPDRENQEKIFGNQLYFNDQDEPIGKCEKFLCSSTSFTINEVVKMVRDRNGIAIPAHIDRPRNSILSNLGMIPSNLSLSCIEISRFADLADFKKRYPAYHILQSSDAHDLGIIGTNNRKLKVPDKRIKSIIEILKQNKSEVTI